MMKNFLPVVLSSLMCTQVSSPQVAPSPEVSKATFPAHSADIPVENVAFLPSLPALPPGKATLLGGKINRLDRVREELTLQTFGGGHTRVLFDGRTHIYVNNGMNAGHRRDLRDGQRVHLDTVLDGTKVFATSIYILPSSTGATGESYGQVVSYRLATGELILRESLSSATLKLRLASNTTIRYQDRPISPMALHPGSLVTVTFDAEGDGRPVAREISVLAQPGDVFEFTGHVTHLDLRAGLLVVKDLLDQRSYEINFNASLLPAANGLQEGASVTVSIGFDGTRYTARTLTVNSSTASRP